MEINSPRIHTYTHRTWVGRSARAVSEKSTDAVSIVCLLSVKAMINDLVNEWKGNIRLLKFVFIST